MIKTVKFLLSKSEAESILDPGEKPGKMARLDENGDDSSMKVDENVPRNIYGIIDEVDDGFALVKSGGEDYIVSSLKLQIKFRKGDKVRLSGFWIEEDFGAKKTFDVLTIESSDIREAKGRVTSLQPYIVFDNKYVLISDGSEEIPELKLHQECKFSVISTEQHLDNLAYQWRVTKIIEVCKLMNLEEIEASIIMNDQTFSLNVDSSSTKDKFIYIQNLTCVDISLINYSLESNSNRFIRLVPENLKRIVTIERKCQWKVLIRIFPRKEGTFTYEFIAEFQALDMKSIQKRIKIILEVYKEKDVVFCERNASVPRFISVRFDDNPVPDELRMIDFTGAYNATEELSNAHPILNEELNKENYLEKMKLGINIEEIAMEQAFNKYSKKRAVFENVEDLLRLEVKDVAEKRPSIAIGDSIFATEVKSGIGGKVYFGHVKKIEEESILVKFCKEFHENHVGRDFQIEFKFSRRQFKQNHHALKTVFDYGLGSDFLFPEVETRYSQIDVDLKEGELKLFGQTRRWYDKKLNRYQKEAVVNILQGVCRPLPYIIYGPPGTGKTLTIVEIIMQLFFLIPNSKIIVAAPSNSAANTFVEALIRTGQFNEPNKFIRFVSNNILEKGLIPEDIEKYCGTISIDSNIESKSNSKGLQINCNKAQICSYRICIGTLSTLGSLMNLDVKDHFTHVIIDEAGQSIEPETLIPITLLKKETGQVILSGDPKQLGPISISRVSKSFKFEVSLLERLLMNNECYARNFGINNNEYDPRFVTKLKINYRSLPSVLELYNKMFYNNELECAIDEDESSEAGLLSIVEPCLWKNQNKNPKCGVYFVDVANGRNKKVKDSSSWYNDEELNAVMSFLHKIPEDFLSNVGVITPYALQVKKLKQKISENMTAETGLKVGTVEEFQGQERNIICLSTVRTADQYIGSDKRYGLGFLVCHRRMNVAISRARSLLVVFGKGEILRRDERWNELIEYTISNSTYFKDERK